MLRSKHLIIMLVMATVAQRTLAEGLLELYQQTLITHPIIKGMEFSIEQAQAGKDQAFSKLLPQVSAVGNLSFNQMNQAQTTAQGQSAPGITTQYMGTRGVIQARQALFDLSSYLRWQGAGFLVLQSEQELEAARMSITADLIDQYFTALQTEDELHYLQGEKTLTESEKVRFKRMEELQLAPVTDLYEVEAYYESLLTKELEMIGAHDVALEQLHRTSGVNITSVQKLSIASLPPVPGEINGWVKEGTIHHPALQAFDHALQAAQKMIHGVKADHLPQLSLQMSETYADNGGYDNRQLAPYNVGTVGVQLNVPIYAGGGIEAGVRDASARYYQTLEKRNDKLREIESEIRKAYVQARTERSRIDSINKEIGAREKARDAQLKSYELRVSTVADLLEAKKNLLKTQFEYAKARYDYIRALVTLKLWSGTLQDQDIEEINRWLYES